MTNFQIWYFVHMNLQVLPPTPGEEFEEYLHMGGGGQNDTVWIIWGASTYQCAKHVANLGVSGGMLPWEILILDLL